MARSLYGRLTRRYRPQPTVLDRREFLKITLAASAGLLLSGGDGFMRSESIRDVGRERKVIVIGAGFGGLACAFSGGPPAERARQRWAREKDAAYVEALTEIYPTFRENFVRGRFMDWPSEMWTGAVTRFPHRNR